MIGGTVLRRIPAPGRIARRLAKRPMVVLSAAALAVRMSKDAMKLKAGEMDAREFRARSGQHVGSVSGSAVGATAGGVAGSIIPGIGPIIGAFAGGMIGDWGGSKFGRRMVEAVENEVRQYQKPDPAPEPEPVDSDT